MVWQACAEFGDVEIPAGSKILAIIGAANRDPEVFNDPDTYLLDRFREGASREFTAASQSLAFGAGLHHCTGSMLAKLEMELAVSALADRFSRLTWAEGSPDDEGYVLRAPTVLRLICEER